MSKRRMHMTTPLFWEDPYRKDFSAKVLKVDGNNIILDQTCFYPEGGGQPGDTGVIKDIKIQDTKFAWDKRTVLHITSVQPNLVISQEVIGQIDWERRYKIMRLHSALHLVFSVFVRKYGEKRVIGSNISDSRARVDFVFYEPIDVDTLKDDVSKVISHSLPIITQSSPDDKYKRFWGVEGFPPVPCGGTHPKNVSEIGNFRLKLEKQGKQGQRIYVILE